MFRREQGVNRHADAVRDLAHEDRGNIAAGMKWQRGATPVGMPILAVRTPLSNHDKAEGQQQGFDLARLEDRNPPHDQATATVWIPTNSASRCGSPSSKSMAITS